MTKIEEVARALCRHGEQDCWKKHTDDARRAIEAMRKPTQAMIGEWLHHRNPEHIGYDSPCDDCATADWQAMIDAALGEKPEWST